MGAKWKAAFAMILFSVAVCAGFGMWKYQAIDKKEERVWHHELASAADPTLGTDSVPEDFMVDGNFTSHLPLVIIDTGGEEIVNYKYYDKKTDAMLYPEGIDVYTQIQISVIDNKNSVNHIGDLPGITSSGKIKVRGNHSALLPKHQYRIKLLNEAGEKSGKPLLGMDTSDDWILNGTQVDRSYLRTYLAMNLMGEMQPYTPDLRYCEVIIKNGGTYRYDGLYMMMEPIERGEGRVEISRYSPGAVSIPYLLKRDRYDASAVSIPTYLDNFPEKRKSWELEWENDAVVSAVYPKEDKITKQSIQKISEEISELEKALYSDDWLEFIQYRQMIDMESFCDYFIINEYLTSYDAGLHSTYFYKDIGGKIKMGPVWDFDGALDNGSHFLTDYNYIVMKQRPWFERMIQDPVFVNKLCERYGALRKNILSDEYVEKVSTEALIFLGNAVKRDISRWGEEYEKNPLDDLTEKGTGLSVQRVRSDTDGEVQRLIDFASLHASYMDQHIHEIYVPWEGKQWRSNSLAVLLILSFFVSIILVQRTRDGLR
ncbi:CotH kinase family protein [Clostridium transplantifaecale]|uniref:CotH kinase family protein n=1 Tax=Clostridium transplantifaecale TaxID=2479838 RepID=UPI000F632990|nr:CotH kinase family protein [Clostridium transplantifaecale]